MRAATFMLADGVRPSNTERGYVLRRLLRRAAQHSQKIGVAQDQGSESILSRCSVIVMEKYRVAYPELGTEAAHREITEEIWKEEKQFGRTLETGMREFEKMAKDGITAEDAFVLFTTYGFPYEMTLEIAKERGLSFDEHDFKKKMKQHQDLSRAGSEKKFKGGLADASEATTRLHTTHHILLKALQIVLGEHVKQRGSNITQERLRIDFSHGAKMTPEQKSAVEKIVNDTLQEDLPVIRSTMQKEEAETLNAEHEFGAKYPDVVSVYSIGPKDATPENPKFDQAFSIEFCGGPHVTHTKDIRVAGHFKITSEEAVAAGVRRIKGVIV
jgi:alanyl-tRNA synthetase